MNINEAGRWDNDRFKFFGSFLFGGARLRRDLAEAVRCVELYRRGRIICLLTYAAVRHVGILLFWMLRAYGVVLSWMTALLVAWGFEGWITGGKGRWYGRLPSVGGAFGPFTSQLHISDLSFYYFFNPFLLIFLPLFFVCFCFGWVCGPDFMWSNEFLNFNIYRHLWIGAFSVVLAGWKRYLNPYIISKINEKKFENFESIKIK